MSAASPFHPERSRRGVEAQRACVLRRVVEVLAGRRFAAGALVGGKTVIRGRQQAMVRRVERHIALPVDPEGMIEGIVPVGESRQQRGQR